MSNIGHYWKDKEERKEIARKHTNEMERKCAANIMKSENNTKVYSIDFECNKTNNGCNTKIVLEDMDSVTAIHAHTFNKTAVLNFASYKHPGGMFINGSKAQEECLCHESFLYNVLSRFSERYYDWNNAHKNKSLYLNRALYTPDVLFFRGDEVTICDVITCAAPNKTSAQKYGHVTDRDNTEALRDRIRYVLDIARENNVNTLILGAYGCGVFGQSPTEVASIFKEYLTTTHKCFTKVVFAIPEGKDNNLKAFMDVWKK